MSEYTPEDFANARFAVNVDGRRAVRMTGGHWRTSKAELYPHVALAEEAGWRPVVEAGDPEAMGALIGSQATRIRELEGEADGAISLDGLRAAWENAEVPTADSPIREGDELIVKHWEEGWGWVAICPGSDSENWISDARILRRAPQREPWQDLVDAIRQGPSVFGTPEDLAKMLHERGVRVTGGDDDE